MSRQKGSTTKKDRPDVDGAWLHIGSAELELETAQHAADRLCTMVVEGALSDGERLDADTFATFMLGINAKMQAALDEIRAASKELR
jgi:hypothetical protein